MAGGHGGHGGAPRWAKSCCWPPSAGCLFYGPVATAYCFRFASMMPTCAQLLLLPPFALFFLFRRNVNSSLLFTAEVFERCACCELTLQIEIVASWPDLCERG